MSISARELIHARVFWSLLTESFSLIRTVYKPQSSCPTSELVLHFTLQPSWPGREAESRRYCWQNFVPYSQLQSSLSTAVSDQRPKIWINKKVFEVILGSTVLIYNRRGGRDRRQFCYFHCTRKIIIYAKKYWVGHKVHLVFFHKRHIFHFHK